MRASRTASLAMGLFLSSMSGQAQAGLISLSATQVGGFYGGDSGPIPPPDNKVTFQNYFVGYGSLSGGGRTPERRSFFIFDLSGITETIVGATLHLSLPDTGGVIFGAAPPGAPTEKDPVEFFKLSKTDFVPGDILGDPPSPALGGIFAALGGFGGPGIAPDFCFGCGPPLSGGPLILIDIVLDGLGLTFLNSRAETEIVLGGSMPSWSFDDRLGPGGGFLEGSELIFGHTDLVPAADPIIPFPILDLVTETVVSDIPEPESILLLLPGLVLMLGLGRKLKRRKA